MKCDNWINPNKTGKKGRLLQSAFVGTYEAKRAMLPVGAERCGGEIIAKVTLENEPYYGGTSAGLDVDYTCSRASANTQ